MSDVYVKSPVENDVQHYRIYRGRESKNYLCKIATSGGPKRAVKVATKIFCLKKGAFAILDDGRFLW